MIFLTSIILIIFLHELGHLLVAKWCKCGVVTFSVGFGKALWSKEINGTVYQIAPILLGGYCQLQGELNYSCSSHAFTNKTYSQKLMISLAGIVMNVITGGISFILGMWLKNNWLVGFGYYSILIGLTNLLPLPALDGSYPLFFLLEKKMGKKKAYELIQKIFDISFIIINILNILSIPLLIYYIYKGVII
jgi:membrane-associated protease RseP (regulator of RpoE activity)